MVRRSIIDVDVRFSVSVQVIEAGKQHRGREIGCHPKQRQVQGGQTQDAYDLFAAILVAPEGGFVALVIHAVLARDTVVLGPVKPKHAALVLAQPVQHVPMSQPFDGVCMEQAQS